MNKWFNTSMSSEEARKVIFSLPRQEFEKNESEIRKEYAEVLPIILKREIDLAKEGWML